MKVGADPSFGGQNVLNDLNFLNELNSSLKWDQPEVERRVKMRDLTVTGTTCDTPIGLPMSM